MDIEMNRLIIRKHGVMGMALRKARASDLTRVMEIKESVVPLMIESGNTQWSKDYPDLERFKEDLRTETLYVFEEEGCVKGFAVVDDDHPYPYDDIPWELTRADSRALHRMAVDPECQGNGISTRMMEEIEDMLIEKGIKGIHTDTSLENEKMQYQFKKSDFEFKGKLNLDDNLDDWYVAYEKVFEDENSE